MKKRLSWILTVITAMTLATASLAAFEMKESIVVKHDFGPIVYAEDFYRLYSLPLYWTEDDLWQNITYLNYALEAPFDFAHRAFCKIETEEEHARYKDLLRMQFHYLITKNYLYLAAYFDKPDVYFHNKQFEETITNCFELAEHYYKKGIEHWKEAQAFSERVVKNKAYIEMDVLLDKAHKIYYGEIDYNKTISRKLNEITEKREKLANFE